MSTNKSRINIGLFTAFVVFVGLFGILASAYYTEVALPKPGSFSSAFAAALTTISVALLGYAIFSFALDTRNWKEYFADRLKEVVIENDYLATLDAETLKDLQTRTLKAQFKNQAIDKEGGFLKYFESNLHRFISDPYRENVTAEVLTNLSKDDPSLLSVTDKVRYVCRSSGGRIQSNVAWKPDDGEFETVISLKISIQFPTGHKDAGKKKVLFEETGSKLAATLVEGAKVLLDDYKDVDALVVITEAEYVVRLGKFQYWTMAHPSKNFDITITYPLSHEIQFKTLVLEDVVSQISNSPGYLNFGYGVWALPQSGIAWLIAPKASARPSTSLVASTPEAAG